MGFNAPVFLFVFLPVSLLVYYFAGSRYKNLVALASSLVFFAWGQLFYVPLMVGVIVVNFFLGKAIEKARAEAGGARRMLVAGIALNLGLLIFFKLVSAYGADWQNLLSVEGPLTWFIQNPLPLGLSYITFQMVSYLFDVTNEVCDSEKSVLDFSLYVLLFPKIIVGPITRYSDLAQQLTAREVTRMGAAQGARRFILGLAKKALIADTLAQIVIPTFAMSTPNFSTGTAWLALTAYTLQLYFDFSGYTDMAIGLGQMFGFRFPENFNYPYLSQSIGEFWRRWHISLSSWFRDYVFYPLERTRRRANRARQMLHVLVVFLLTGLWHGLTLTFAIWGLIHGIAIAIEMAGFGRVLKKTWRPLQHLYALAVVMLGWVFFRSSTLLYALQFLARLFGWQGGISPVPFPDSLPLSMIDPSVWLALVLGIIFSLPVLPFLQEAWKRYLQRRPLAPAPLIFGMNLFLLLLFGASVALTVSRPSVASIYGGF